MIDAFLGFFLLLPISVAAISVFLILEFKNASKTAKINGTVLIALGIFAAASAGELHSILNGFERSRIFLVMFFAVSWLQTPARKSQALNRVRQTISLQPPGRRYLMTASGVHGLGAVLNLAGLSLIASIVKKTQGIELKRRFIMALMIGFTSGSCWSPFYLSVVVVLVAVPTINLLDVAPLGVGIAVTSMLVGWGYDRLRFGSSKRLDASKATPLMLFEWAHVLGILGSLAGLIFFIIYFMEITIPIALGLITPIYSIIWWLSMHKVNSNFSQTVIRLTEHVVSSFGSLRNEALVFVAATVFGAGVSSAIPEAVVAEFLSKYLPLIVSRIACLTFSVLLLGMMGVHPVVTVIFIGEFLSPGILGVEDWVMGLSLLSVWGLSTMVNPYSATTLYLARTTRVSPFLIAWRWNIPVCLLATSVSTSIIVLLWRFL